MLFLTITFAAVLGKVSLQDHQSRWNESKILQNVEWISQPSALPTEPLPKKRLVSISITKEISLKLPKLYLEESSNKHHLLEVINQYLWSPTQRGTYSFVSNLTDIGEFLANQKFINVPNFNRLFRRRPHDHHQRKLQQLPLDPEVLKSASLPEGVVKKATVKNHKNRHLLPKNCGAQVTKNILGGAETDIDDFPWMALVRVNISQENPFRCAGSLITQRYVLTAAHCVRIHGIPEEKVDLVRLGEHDLRQEKDCQDWNCNLPPQDVPIEERIVHPGFNASLHSSPHDIALLRLKKPVEFSQFVQPICLPLNKLSEKTYDGLAMWTAGWGFTEHGSKSKMKLKVKLPVVPLEACAKKYVRIPLVRSQICAGGEMKKDSCGGDSGAPLMNQDLVGEVVRWILQGIVSFGSSKCGSTGIPGVYTRVANYVQWIMNEIRE